VARAPVEHPSSFATIRKVINPTTGMARGGPFPATHAIQRYDYHYAYELSHNNKKRGESGATHIS
jgi:hypothetical protein